MRGSVYRGNRAPTLFPGEGALGWAKESDPVTALGAHRRQVHDNSEFGITVEILSQELRTSARKTLEAFWITAKSPKMNRKDECLAITNELAPFLDLCRF